jgi:methionyl aminopeptidase
MIFIKTPEEIRILREGGKILASVLLMVRDMAKAGIATKELDEYAENLIKKANGEPSFKNYKTPRDKFPFPASLCVSVNDEVVHGIPSGRILKEGDIVSLDLGLKWMGLYTDATITIGVGKINAETEKLLNITKTALEKGIGVIKEGVTTGDIGYAIQSYVEKQRLPAGRQGFNVVKKLVGHGVGHKVHEEPEIPNFGERGEGVVLKEGMVLALEPMVVIGSGDVFLDKNNWTWKTKDGSLAAQFEHTVGVTKRGCEVLTKI